MEARTRKTASNGERLGLGDRLLLARKRRGLRQIDAAREIGVCRETIARIELDHIPNARTRAKVLRWLEAQEEWAAAAELVARRGSARLARARERRAAAKRIGGRRRRQLARLLLRRRTARARRAAALPAGAVKEEQP